MLCKRSACYPFPLGPRRPPRGRVSFSAHVGVGDGTGGFLVEAQDAPRFVGRDADRASNSHARDLAALHSGVQRIR